MSRESGGMIFWLVLAAGIVMVTMVYVLLQAGGTAVSIGPDVHLSDADKVFIDQMAEQTKWLESLAYASLVGLVLRVKDTRAGLSRTSALAAALLIVSLYAGFLSRDVILIALTKGSPLLHATLGSMPYTTQFWCLIAGLALLARDFLWPKITATAGPVAALLLLFVGFMAAHAQTPTASQQAPTSGSCSAGWVQSRFSKEAATDQQSMLADFLGRTAERSGVPASALKTCDFAYSTLDKVRSSSQVMNGEDTLPDTLALIASLRDQLHANDASPGALLQTFLDSMRVWQKPTGSIAIQTQRSGATVTINSQLKGSAPLLYVDKPGDYKVRIILGGVVLLQKTVTVVENVQAVLTVP